MLLDPRQLEQLAAIVDHNTLQEAAVFLGTSQPALSRMVRQMEERTGVLLFVRGSRPLAVTEMGRRLSDQGRAIKAARTRAAQDIALSLRGMSGQLKVGASPFMCDRLVGDALSTFYAERPDIEVELISDYIPGLERGILLNRIDVVICPVKLVLASKDELLVEPLFKDEHVIVARKDHPLVRKAQVTTDDLESAGWIGHAQRSMLYADMATALASVGVTNLRFSFLSESAGANLEMLRRTDFLTVLPRYALSKTQTDSGLSVLSVRFETAALTVGMVTLKQRPPSALLAAFKSHARRYVAASGLAQS